MNKEIEAFACSLRAAWLRHGAQSKSSAARHSSRFGRSSVVKAFSGDPEKIGGMRFGMLLSILSAMNLEVSIQGLGCTGLSSFGAAISEYRKKLNITQAKVSMDAGVSRDLLSRLENGSVNFTHKHDVKVRSALAICRALGVSPEVRPIQGPDLTSIPENLFGGP